jgi:hypothetical protein
MVSAAGAIRTIVTAGEQGDEDDGNGGSEAMHGVLR